MTTKMKMTLVWFALIILVAIVLIVVSSGASSSLVGRWLPQTLGHCVASYCTL